MKDERYKKLMEDVGMPNSRSLLGALQQVANEVEQEVRAEFKDTTQFKDVYEKQSIFEDLILMKSKTWPKKPLKEYDEKERVSFSKELSLYLYQEIGEYVNAVGNYKMHKTQADGKPVKDVKEEIADILIFALDLALVNGMTAEELLTEIAKKQDKNFKRQQNGY
jgi:NTP pyrophosphatase (non-canonical NTP hydrolase)